MQNEIFKYFGGKAKLAKELMVSRSCVSQWVKRGIPAVRAMEIEELSCGRFKAAEIITRWLD